jgi:TolB-like protein/DNA-binding winged helix-turn-helix (wHTH) protein
VIPASFLRDHCLISCIVLIRFTPSWSRVRRTILNMQKPRTISFDEWTLHRESGELEKQGKRVRLPDQAHEILEELLDRAGELVTREQLIARLWPHGVVEFETSLNAAVRKLRSALGDDADTPRYIETVPRKGYRFIGTLAQPQTDPVGSLASRPIVSMRSSLSKRWPWAIGVLLLMIAILVGSVALRSPEQTATRVRLAVMPFDNLSPDPQNAFFTDGMHEEILSTLAARATNMDVISRTTMMSYKDRPSSVAEIAKALSATHLLEGSVRREADAIRVTLQLVDARADRNLWSQSYDRQLVNSMTLQSQVAAEVASQLAVKLLADSGELPRSANATAYDLYLKAKLANQGIVVSTPVAELDRVESWLTRAIELDNAFAAGYVERAHVRLFKFGYSHDLTERNLEAASADIRTARELVGETAAVLQLQSRYAQAVEMDLKKALSFVDSPTMAVSREPSVMRWRAFILTNAGRTDEALALYARVAALDPGNQTNFFSWQLALKRMGRGADAIAVARSFNEHGPGRVYFGDVEFAFAGRVDRLREDIERMGDAIDADARLAASFDLLRFERRFAELRELLAGVNAAMIRPAALRETPLPGIGKKPLAELRGWTDLLMKDEPAAAIEGRLLLDFVAREPVTNWNRWHLRCLAAEGAVFSGENARAISEAHAALAMVPSDRPNQRRYAFVLMARVLAWAGAKDEAVALLEELSSGYPRLGPAEITRDPLYSVPLSDNRRYKALEKKLEAEIEQNSKLF